jgi:hypothetical protein
MTTETKRDPYRTTYHRDGTVTVWDVYRQCWHRTARPDDHILASMSHADRARAMRHCRHAIGVNP